MKYLDDKFRTELTASVDETTGKVCIGTLELDPLSILSTDEAAYRETFGQWKTERERFLIDEAVAMLEENRSNADAFRALCQAYKTQKVTPFLGAGVSKPSGYPLWTEFLYHLCDQTECSAEAITQYIRNGEYEEAAEYLYNNMPEQAFDIEIDMVFGTPREIEGVVRSLPRFFNGAIITTNFDSILSDVYREAGANFDGTLVGQQAEELPRRLTSEERVLVQLHGKATSARNRVLTKSEYDRAYESTDAVINVISAITQNPLLFIGCSLNVDRTIRTMRDIHASRRNQDFCRHFAFLPVGEETNFKRVKHDLSQANIVPIWYSGDHDQCIEGLLLTMEERQRATR